MKSFLQSAMAGIEADYIEIRLEDTSSLSILCAGKTLEKAQETRDSGGYVRVLDGGGWGFVSFNDPGMLRERVQEACTLARAARTGTSMIYDVKPVVDMLRPEIVHDPRQISFDEKIKTAGRFAKKLFEYDPKIISSRASYFETVSRVQLGTNHGTYIDREDLDMKWGVAAIGKDGGVVQSVGKGFGSRKNFNLWLKMEGDLEEIAKQTLELLKAEPVQSGRRTVILDQRLAGVFIHEAFGHLSEADYIAENDKLKRDMALGSRFGADHLNVMDGGGGELSGHRGSLKYDDEGVPQTATYLIKNGILSGRLHSRETAAIMGEHPTGNARTISYHFAPICRMTNTCIQPGESTFEEMLEGIQDGLYVSGGGSGNTTNEMFTFAAEKGYTIKNGKLGGLVRDIVLTGNVFETLKNIDMVGNDIKWGEGGNCGRTVGQRLQYPLAVTMASPHIRIQKMLVGGR